MEVLGTISDKETPRGQPAVSLSNAPTKDNAQSGHDMEDDINFEPQPEPKLTFSKHKENVLWAEEIKPDMSYMVALKYDQLGDYMAWTDPDYEGERWKKHFYEDGGIYLGEFKPGADCKQGYGTYIYPEGDMYQGHWHNN